MDRFRAAIDELVDKVKEAINGEPKSPVEILLDQHLSLDEEVVSFSPKNCTSVAIPTAVLNDLAARTKNIVDYPFIMERVWEILVDHQHDPALMKKALNLLHFLLINGAIQVLKDCQQSVRMTFLKNLTEDYNRYEFEQYQFSQHLDVGAGVRKTAAEIFHFLTNERELFHARRQADVLHQKLSDRGLRRSPSSALVASPPMSPSLSNEIRPPRYTDHYAAADDNIGLQFVTHPEELFDETPHRSLRNIASSPSNLAYENHKTGDISGTDRPPATMRGHSRQQRSRDSNEEEHTRQSPKQKPTAPKQIEGSVDLLGLEALDLELTAAMPSPPKMKAAGPRTQSARTPPPQHSFSATI